MPCGMYIQNGIQWHAAQTACIKAYQFRLRTAGQSAARPGSERRPTSRVLHMCARGMACCMHVDHDTRKDTCTINMCQGDCRGLCASLSENRRNRMCVIIHVKPCRSFMAFMCACGMCHRRARGSRARRVDRHGFSRGMSGLVGLKYT